MRASQSSTSGVTVTPLRRTWGTGTAGPVFLSDYKAKEILIDSSVTRLQHLGAMMFFMVFIAPALIAVLATVIVFVWMRKPNSDV